MSHPLWQADRMKIIKALQTLIQNVFVLRLTVTHNPPTPPAPVNLDAPTDRGLTLREAIPIRSAEYWLALGHPELALDELDTLNIHARQHPWPRQVRQQAALATAH